MKQIKLFAEILNDNHSIKSIQVVEAYLFICFLKANRNSTRKSGYIFSDELDDLSKYIDVSVSTLRRILSRCVESGFITYHKHASGNYYTLKSLTSIHDQLGFRNYIHPKTKKSYCAFNTFEVTSYKHLRLLYYSQLLIQARNRFHNVLEKANKLHNLRVADSAYANDLRSIAQLGVFKNYTENTAINMIRTLNTNSVAAGFLSMTKGKSAPYGSGLANVYDLRRFETTTLNGTKKIASRAYSTVAHNKSLSQKFLSFVDEHKSFFKEMKILKSDRKVSTRQINKILGILLRDKFGKNIVNHVIPDNQIRVSYRDILIKQDGRWIKSEKPVYQLVNEDGNFRLIDWKKVRREASDRLHEIFKDYPSIYVIYNSV